MLSILKFQTVDSDHGIFSQVVHNLSGGSIVSLSQIVFLNALNLLFASSWAICWAFILGTILVEFPQSEVWLLLYEILCNKPILSGSDLQAFFHVRITSVLFQVSYYSLTIVLHCMNLSKSMEKGFKFSTMKLGKSMMPTLITFLMSLTLRTEANGLLLYWCICKYI